MAQFRVEGVPQHERHCLPTRCSLGLPSGRMQPAPLFIAIGCLVACSGPRTNPGIATAATTAPSTASSAPHSKLNDALAATVPDTASLPIEGVQVDGSKFSIKIHDDIVKDIASNPKARSCTNILVRAQWLQDSWHQSESKAHFDNCAFAEGVAYVRELTDEADTAAAAGRFDDALFAYGQALHAIADFYAHSNYVERAVADKKEWPIDIARIWTDTGAKAIEAAAAKGLISGRWPIGTPTRCAANGPSHDDLNKDSPKSTNGAVVITLPNWDKRTHHQAAKETALAATRTYLERAFRRADALAAHCGWIVGYLPAVDTREGKP